MTSVLVKDVKKHGGFTLPFTGGTGVMVFTVLGLVVAAGAAVMVVVVRRRQSVVG
ncbi:LPXTG cell wall anchor domain-containing protein [Xylanimonas allomyrinae]|uniref:LPXTG cell wall anchor domain-containing protein n=1 Tax=Xylanimonas allomyrinae TaxID=2509459 RepID=A0A4P6EQT9_9MICO|nr:LPXTG cell wall anchor domain-containing protein [Xylanimonas allomyrinae]QAY63809.1 LPXTG cell wall anchor domain-containing protein [Xylanimonas allomyrinae]